jgi:nicotinamidase-related amidase
MEENEQMRRHRVLLDRGDCALVVIDAQERLIPALSGADKAVANIVRLVKFAGIVGLPVICTEQQKLGSTAVEIRAELPREEPMLKAEFDCLLNPAICDRLERVRMSTLILAGFEAHICVAQTALHAAETHLVHVVSDAVASRDPENKAVALERLRRAGVVVTSTEMVIYEILQRAGTDEFRSVLPLVK